MYQVVPAVGAVAILYVVLVAGVATTAVAARTACRRRAALTVLRLLLRRGR